MQSYYQSRALFIDKLVKDANFTSVFASESTPEFSPELLTPDELSRCHRGLDYCKSHNPMGKAKTLLLWLSYQTRVTNRERDNVFSLVLFYWLQDAKRSGLIAPNAVFILQMKNTIQNRLLSIGHGDLAHRIAQLGLDPKRLKVKDLCELSSSDKCIGKIDEYTPFMSPGVREKLPHHLS